MSNVKIAITGTNGFLGQNLLQQCLSNKLSITTLNRSSDPKYNGSYKQYTGCISNTSVVEQFLEGSKVLVHLAWDGKPSHDMNLDVTKENILGTLHLIDVAKKQGVEKIIFASSGGTVYGEKSVGLLTEDMICEPINFYAATKLSCEQMIRVYCETNNMQAIILRIANPYGPAQKPNAGQGLIATCISKALKNEVLTIWGDGQIVRDYIYVQDVCDAIIKMFDYTDSSNIFNVGSGSGQSVNEIVAMVEKMLKKKIEINREDSRHIDIQKVVLDISKIKKIVGWSPKVTFQEGLEDTIKWIKNM